MRPVESARCLRAGGLDGDQLIPAVLHPARLFEIQAHHKDVERL